MKFQCPNCLKWIRDKAFFGTIHVCATQEEVSHAYKHNPLYRKQRDEAFKNLPPWLK